MASIWAGVYTRFMPGQDSGDALITTVLISYPGLAGLLPEIVVRPSQRHEAHRNRNRLNEDTVMGLVLLAVAMLAFGIYTLFVFIGFIADLLKH